MRVAVTRKAEIPKAELLDLRREIAFEIPKNAINVEARTVDLSFASEAPYERWFGIEVLDCSTDAVMLDRLNNGGALLKDHNREKQTGVVLRGSAKSTNKKLHATVKFSKSQIGNEEWQDVQDGIRTLVSVGYIVHKMILEKEENGKEFYRVTQWEPYEVSIVSIPVDSTVGVGKELDETLIKQKKSMLRKLYANVNLDADAGGTGGGGGGTAVAAAPETSATRGAAEQRSRVEAGDNVIAEKALRDERARQKEIRAVAKRLNTEIGNQIAEKAIEDGTSVDAFNREVLQKCFNAQPVVAPAGGVIGMNDKEVRRFSLLKACRDMALRGSLEGIEKEACEAAAKIMNREVQVQGTQRGFILPEDINRSAFEGLLMKMISERAQNATTFTAGGALVQNQYGAMIEFLRNKTVLGRLGITIMDGLVGNFLLPVQTGGATAYWVSETGALTDSQATFAQKAMTPHRLGATIPYTTQFLAQSSISAEDFFRNELQTVCALKKDLAGLEGTGNDGQPLGVKGTLGINATVTFGGAADWADVVQFETGIAVDNADIGAMGFALSAGSVGKWKTILKVTAGASGDFLIDGGGDNMAANGYPVRRTNQITGDIAFFGVWSQLLHAIWAGVEIIVDPYALKKSGQVEITRNEMCDYLVRQPLAFNVSTDSAAQ